MILLSKSDIQQAKLELEFCLKGDGSSFYTAFFDAISKAHPLMKRQLCKSLPAEVYVWCEKFMQLEVLDGFVEVEE